MSNDYICDCDICKTPITKGQNFRESGVECWHADLIYCVKGLRQQIAAERAKLALAVEALRRLTDDALAEIRREVARECAEILCALLAAQKTKLNGNPLTDGRYQGIRRCIYAIRAKFGVTA